MFSSTCPSCGAPVSFLSSASTTAVCAFCKSTLSRDAGTLALIGKQGELLEDYSRLQIGTTGKVVHGNQLHAFSLIGRIQLRFDSGYWNEWYLLFDNGQTAWLSDASGQYVLLQELQLNEAIPSYDSVAVGQPINIANKPFTVTDKRTSECIGGQGELPFAASSTWQARTVDCRSASDFISLDFSDDKAVAYLGKTIAFEGLSLGHLRDTKDRFTGEAVAGQLAKTTVKSLNCSSCSAPIKLVLGQTNHLICPSCGSALREQNDSLILEIERKNIARAATALQPGDTGEIDGTQWIILGVLVRHEKTDPGSSWEEYLLFESLKGFAWLSNVQGAWQMIDVLNEQPILAGDKASVGNLTYNRTFEYIAITSYAAGSFNWKPEVGNAVKVTEYKSGQRSLSSEQTDTELTWSRGKPVAANVILRAFGKISKDTNQTTQKAGSLLVPTLVASLVMVVAIGPAYFMPSLASNPLGGIFAMLVLWGPYIFSKIDTSKLKNDSDTDAGD